MNSEGIYLLLAVLGFIFLVVTLTLLVINTLKTLNAIKDTCNLLEKQIKGFENDLGKIFHQTSEFSENLNHKMQSLDPIFHTIHHFGERVEEKVAKKKDEEFIEYLNNKIEHKQESFTMTDQVIELANVIIRSLELYNKLKKRR